MYASLPSVHTYIHACLEVYDVCVRNGSTVENIEPLFHFSRALLYMLEETRDRADTRGLWCLDECLDR